MDPLLRAFVEIPEEGSPLVPITFVLGTGEAVIGAISPRGAFAEAVNEYLDDLIRDHPELPSLRQLVAKFREFAIGHEESDDRYVTLQNAQLVSTRSKAGYQVPMLRLDLDAVTGWYIGSPNPLPG